MKTIFKIESTDSAIFITLSEDAVPKGDLSNINADYLGSELAYLKFIEAKKLDNNLVQIEYQYNKDMYKQLLANTIFTTGNYSENKDLIIRTILDNNDINIISYYQTILLNLSNTILINDIASKNQLKEIYDKVDILIEDMKGLMKKSNIGDALKKPLEYEKRISSVKDEITDIE